MSSDTPGGRSALFAIFLIVTVDILGLAIVLPLLPFYAERFGASPPVVGALVTTYALCQLVAGPLLGRLSDTIGRKPVLVASQIGTLMGFVLLARAHSLGMIFLSRLIDGVTAGNLPIAQAVISDGTAPKDRARAFGIIGIAFGIGFFIGPGISGYLTRYGFAAPAWAAAGLSLMSILFSALLLPSKKSARQTVLQTSNPQSMRHFFRMPVLRWRLLQFFCFGLAFSSFMSGFALFAERRFMAHGHRFGPLEVGTFYTYLGALAIVVQGFLLGRLVKRFGEDRLVIAGFLMQAAGYSAMAYLFRTPWLYVWGAVGSMGSGVVRPALTSLVSQAAEPSRQGAVLGVNQSLASLAQVLAPLMAGFFIGQMNLNAWAFCTGGFGICGLLLQVAKSQPSRGS